MPDAIANLEKELKTLQSQKEKDLKIAGLKGQIKQLKKAENIKAFDKKHPIFAKIGQVGSAGFKAGKRFLAQRPGQTKSTGMADINKLVFGGTPKQKQLKKEIKKKQKKDPLDFIMRI